MTDTNENPALAEGSAFDARPTREQIAAEVKRITHAWSGPSMDEFLDDPPTRKQFAIADAVLGLLGARSDSLAAHDAEVKAQGQASALRQISNAVRDPDRLMSLSPHALADVLWAEAEKHDPVEKARARAAARGEGTSG